MAKSRFAICRLTPDDLPHMRALNVLFGKAFQEAETYGSAPPSDSYIIDLLAKSHVIVVVALVDGDVVGGLVAYELDKFEQVRREIYIYDLAVGEPHRRVGIATALIAKVQDIAIQRGAWVIFVQADQGDEPAIALYERLGTHEAVLHFDISPRTSE